MPEEGSDDISEASWPSWHRAERREKVPRGTVSGSQLLCRRPYILPLNSVKVLDTQKGQVSVTFCLCLLGELENLPTSMHTPSRAPAQQIPGVK